MSRLSLEFPGRTAITCSFAVLGALLTAAAPASAALPAAAAAPDASRAARGSTAEWIKQLACDSDDPSGTAALLLMRLRNTPACFPDTLTKEEWERIMEEYMFLPPTQFSTLEDYFTDTTVWVGDVTTGPSGKAAPARLTYSFPADGTTWGLSAVSATGPSNLSASLTATFGAADLDEGREYIRQGLAAWRANSGMTYQEVADSNIPMDQVQTRRTTVGDTRIGGLGFGTGSFLAYNAFPTPTFAGVGGSDMCINTSFFIPANFGSSTNDYRYLRNTMGHEHGHGLGYIHTVPCNGVFLMEPVIQTNTNVLSIDEVRGAQRNYGDRFAGNRTAALAKDFGNLTSPSLKSVFERNLSTNGLADPNFNQDWFKFTTGSTQNIIITVTPTGGTYTQGQQSGGCSGTTASVNATQAGNLTVEFRSGDGVTLIQAASGAIGTARTITRNGQAAGTYTVKVIDVGPNAAANQTLQLYNMTIRVASALAPPFAIAGLNKRVQANTNCFFNGFPNSYSAETGALLNDPNSYDWDLDGDGTFEALNNQRPSRQYVSNGVYNAMLRLTDATNPHVGTDTITVTVFGATTTVTSVAPNNGNRGQAVPVTINGTNFKNVTLASMVTVSGTGVTVSGTPVSNLLGTQITGLSFVIAANATLGLRNVTVSNADGTGTGNNVFTVNTGPTVTSVVPNNGQQRVTVPVTLNGTKLGNVTSAAQVVVSGAGVTVTGTPVATPTQVTGLSFAISPTAALGARTVTVTTSEGTGTSGNVFTVLAGCAGDADRDGDTDQDDLDLILFNFGLAVTPFNNGDVNGNGFVDQDDLDQLLFDFGCT